MEHGLELMRNAAGILLFVVALTFASALLAETEEMFERAAERSRQDRTYYLTKEVWE